MERGTFQKLGVVSSQILNHPLSLVGSLAMEVFSLKYYPWMWKAVVDKQIRLHKRIIRNLKSQNRQILKNTPTVNVSSILDENGEFRNGIDADAIKTFREANKDSAITPPFPQKTWEDTSARMLLDSRRKCSFDDPEANTYYFGILAREELTLEEAIQAIVEWEWVYNSASRRKITKENINPRAEGELIERFKNEVNSYIRERLASL